MERFSLRRIAIRSLRIGAPAVLVTPRTRLTVTAADG
jgi:hypothetical protein